MRGHAAGVTGAMGDDARREEIGYREVFRILRTIYTTRNVSISLRAFRTTLYIRISYMKKLGNAIRIKLYI